MPLVLADRVQETTSTTGTGTVTLLGAVSGFQSFAAVGNGNTTYYCIASQTANEWEVGIGTYTSAGTTLSRTTVLASSNAGSLVNFSAGNKNVFVTYPSSRSIYADGTTLQTTNSAILPASSGGTGASTLTGYVYGNGTGVMTASTSIPNSATTATSANTASAIVARDASGNFSAGTITAALSGNATTASTASATTAAVTFNNGGTGAASGTTFNGSTAQTVSYNTVGAQPTLVSGTNIKTVNGNSLLGSGDISVSASPGGATTQVQYNNAGAFAGSANLTFNGTNLTCGGTITANSDETLKTNWRDYQPDFVEQLAQIKHGTYDRPDIEMTQDGVSAQSLLRLLPYSVLCGEDGKLSVAYGNAALVAAVQLAQRVVIQDARIAKLEAIVAKLTEDK